MEKECGKGSQIYSQHVLWEWVFNLALRFLTEKIKRGKKEGCNFYFTDKGYYSLKSNKMHHAGSFIDSIEMHNRE